MYKLTKKIALIISGCFSGQGEHLKQIFNPRVQSVPFQMQNDAFWELPFQQQCEILEQYPVMVFTRFTHFYGSKDIPEMFLPMIQKCVIKLLETNTKLCYRRIGFIQRIKVFFSDAQKEKFREHLTMLDPEDLIRTIAKIIREESEQSKIYQNALEVVAHNRGLQSKIIKLDPSLSETMIQIMQFWRDAKKKKPSFPPNLEICQKYREELECIKTHPKSFIDLPLELKGNPRFRKECIRANANVAYYMDQFLGPNESVMLIDLNPFDEEMNTLILRSVSIKQRNDIEKHIHKQQHEQREEERK